MMLNFDKVFFDLLIMVTMSQYSLSQTLVAPIASMIEVTDPPGRNIISYTRTSSFYQYENEDRFLIQDTDPEATLASNLGGDFASNAIEFCSFHNSTFEFYHRRSDNQVIRVKCSFAHEDLVRKFFNSIYRLQNKGRVFHVFRMARYNNDTNEIQKLLDTQSTLYAKDTKLFTEGAVMKTYSISSYSDTSQLLEPILIFHSGAFSVSKIHNGNKIAVCLKDFPNERFLIAFTGVRPCRMLLRTQMQPFMQVAGLECKFPELGDLQEFYYLGD